MCRQLTTRIVVTLILVGSAVLAPTTGATSAGSPTVDVANSASGDPVISKATHYVDSEEGPIVELAFDENVTATNPAVTIHIENGKNLTVPSSKITAPDGGRVVVDTDGAVIPRIASVTVSGYVDSDGNSLGSVREPVRFAPETVDTGGESSVNAFKGANVAIEAEAGDSIQINANTDDTIQYSVVRNTGHNSEVYVWDTNSRTLGDYRIENRRTATNSSLTLGDLDIEIDPDETAFDATENVTAVVSMNDINRHIDVTLLDANGQTVAVREAVTRADGEVQVDFGQLPPGDYILRTTAVAVGTSDQTPPVQVGSGTSVVARYDTNGRPGIQPGEAQDAIADLNQGLLSPRDAQTVIAAL